LVLGREVRKGERIPYMVSMDGDGAMTKMELGV